MKILKRLKAIRIKIYFEKKYFKEFANTFDFKQTISSLIDTHSLGGYLSMPFLFIAIGFVWSFWSPFILLASIKFGEREG